MRRLALTLAVMLAVAGLAQAASIDGSPHDLGSYDGTNQRICVFCHTPHEAVAKDAPLWNHSDSAATYTMYSSDTLDASPSLTAGGSNISALCMSCHDGTIALGSVSNTPRTAITNTTDAMATTVAGYLGTDLSNDHPVGFDFTSTLVTNDGGLNDPTALSYAAVFGTNNTVECASCHDVHDNANQPFLLVANTGSQLCLDCHNK